MAIRTARPAAGSAPIILLLLAVGAGILAFLFWAARPPAKATGSLRDALRPFLAAEASSPRSKRVLLLGWDGATFNMIDPLRTAGRLPNLSRLAERGLTANLESTIIPISAAAWSGAVTGMGPGKSGVFGFFEPTPGAYETRLIDSHQRRSPSLWHVLNQHGLRTHVIGMPVSYPPDRVDGVMFGCMLAPFDADYAHPPGLTPVLRAHGYLPDLDAWRSQQAFSMDAVARQHEIMTNVVDAVLRDSAWDFAMIVYKSLDVLSHRMYDGRLDTPVATHYEQLDAALGRILDAVGPQTDILLMSDHGFGGYQYFLSVNGLLAELGYVKRRADARAPTPTADAPIGEMMTALLDSDLAALDVEHTVAFAGPTEANFASIRLNLAGREPRGSVTAEMRQDVLEQLRQRLSELRHPRDGWPLVRQTIPFEQLYPGPFAAEMPDLLVEFDSRISCKPWFRAPWLAPFRVPSPDHERNGVLIAAGPSIRVSADRATASILDVAPTVLALLDLPALEGMDGRVMQDLLIEYSPKPAVSVEAYELRRIESQSAAVGGSQDVIKRMQALQYVDDNRQNP